MPQATQTFVPGGSLRVQLGQTTGGPVGGGGDGRAGAWPSVRRGVRRSPGSAAYTSPTRHSGVSSAGTGGGFDGARATAAGRAGTDRADATGTGRSGARAGEGDPGLGASGAPGSNALGGAAVGSAGAPRVARARYVSS